MRDLLATTGSAELTYQLAFLDLEDERLRLETAAAIALALGGGEG